MKQGQFPAVLPLASLNGQNGFKIDGENNWRSTVAIPLVMQEILMAISMLIC